MGELVALRWSDVPWSERVLVVERALSGDVEGTTKGRRIRYVPLGDQAFGARPARRSSPGALADAATAANADTIWLSDERVQGWNDPERPEVMVNLVWDLHALVASALAQREGISNQGPNVALLEALGAWAQYRRLVTYGEFEKGLLVLPVTEDLASVGKLAGWAAAGDPAARVRVASLGDESRRVADALVNELLEHRPGAPTVLLDAARR